MATANRNAANAKVAATTADPATKAATTRTRTSAGSTADARAGTTAPARDANAAAGTTDQADGSSADEPRHYRRTSSAIHLATTKVRAGRN